MGSREAIPSALEPAPARWSVGGLFLEALCARDDQRLGSTLADDVCLQALLPVGYSEWTGRSLTVGALWEWFGAAVDFEVLDVAAGEVEGLLHLSWRFRLRPAPFGIGDGWHVIEQQAYVEAGDRLSSIRLLSSGFRAERRDLGATAHDAGGKP